MSNTPQKHIPILFSTPMVHGIMEDRKTMTRRTNGLELFNDAADRPIDDDDPGRWFYAGLKDGIAHMECMDTFESYEIKCPYGKIGDILWVRETFAYSFMRLRYKADYDWTEEEKENLENNRWKPNIHMPKTACRIWLRVTDLRLERVQDITESDAISEGILDMWAHLDNNVAAYKKYGVTQKEYEEDGPWSGVADDAIHSFQSLWQSINGPESWDDNPWVWVVSFERCEMPDGFLTPKT